MTDNFKQISGLLKFDSPDDFYFLQILQRNKEHPDLGNNNRRIHEYYIHNVEQLMKYYNEITMYCHHFGARAYIHINRRNRRQIALEMLALLAHNIKSNQYEGISRIYESTCGKHHSEKDKLWVVDIDTKASTVISRVMETIQEIKSIHSADLWKEFALIPTKNGFHLITEGFNSVMFSKMLSELTAKPSPHHGAIVEIHKNNPTLLYIP